MGNRCGLFHRSVLFVSVFSAVGWAQTQLCALTHPLPPKWEIINTHQSNTGPCCLQHCPIWKDTKNLDVLMFLRIKQSATLHPCSDLCPAWIYQSYIHLYSSLNPTSAMFIKQSDLQEIPLLKSGFPFHVFFFPSQFRC